MPSSDSSLRVWAGRAFRKPGRCGYCHKSITWITTDKNKELPFDPGAMPIAEQVVDTDGRRFDVMRFSDMHRCEERKNAQRKRPRLF